MKELLYAVAFILFLIGLLLIGLPWLVTVNVQGTDQAGLIALAFSILTAWLASSLDGEK